MEESYTNFSPHPVEWTIEKSSRVWDFYGKQDAFSDMYFAKQVGEHVAIVARRAGLKKAEAILDVSCGRGDLIARLLPHMKSGQKAYAADVSPESVAETQGRFADTPAFQGAFHISDGAIELPRDEFDFLFFTEVIEHLSPEETQPVLRQLRDLTAPGGKILITTPNAENLAASSVLCPDCGCIFHRWQHQQRWDVDSLPKALSKAGWSPIETKTIRWGGTLAKRMLFPVLCMLGLIERTGLYCIATRK